MNVEAVNALRFSVLGNREIGRGKSPHRISHCVGNDYVNHDAAHVLMDDEIAGFGLPEGQLRRIRNLWRLRSRNTDLGKNGAGTENDRQNKETGSEKSRSAHCKLPPPAKAAGFGRLILLQVRSTECQQFVDGFRRTVALCRSLSADVAVPATLR